MNPISFRVTFRLIQKAVLVIERTGAVDRVFCAGITTRFSILYLRTCVGLRFGKKRIPSPGLVPMIVDVELSTAYTDRLDEQVLLTVLKFLDALDYRIF
jgi:hypothetical protein